MGFEGEWRWDDDSSTFAVHKLVFSVDKKQRAHRKCAGSREASPCRFSTRYYILKYEDS
jgi:hypothetical protein